MFRKVLLLQLLLLAFGYCLHAQIPAGAQTVQVDNLTDDQIRQLVTQMKEKGVTFNQIDEYAVQRGISDTEVGKLKQRIQQLNLDSELGESGGSGGSGKITGDNSERRYSGGQDTIYYWKDQYQQIKNKEEYDREMRRRKVFGAELFSTQNLTFEPNLRIPTPPNYRIAADDELLIDVYGYSEVQHSLKVSPEGYVRIPYLGPVYVNGLTMEEARIRITKQLGTIYSGIKTGNTSVQVSLGNIRSIKVLLIGEVMRPGTYTIPSLATVVNALYVSGGPNENGSFRAIEVVRNGKTVATFDLYDFLLHGDLSNNIVLQDQDIVKVNPYKTRVELTGAVKHPAVFETKSKETLQDVIDFAGGYTDNSFRDIVRALRITDKQRQFVNISGDSVASFRLKSGDKFYIDSITDHFENRVIISGAIFHPGSYGLEEGMSVADLIKKADGVQEVAATARGMIRRLKDDFTPATISFNVLDEINGKSKTLLKREDSVVIFSKLALREQYVVRITGEVNQPGNYSYGEGMQLEDLVLLAGGLRDAASLKHLEISRRIRGGGDYDSSDIRMAITQQFDVNADLSSNAAAAGFILQPFDEVIVRRAPSYNQQSNVLIDGEIAYPGTYAINTKQEHISDLVKRAGGLRPEASAEGAVLLRRTYINDQDSALLRSKLEVFFNKARDSADVERTKATVERNTQLVGIQLEKILEHPGSKYDLLLEEGDVIRVPKKLQTVQLFGELYFPKKVRFDKEITFRSYVRSAGGFTSQALKRRSYIIYANGEVKSTRKLLFFNSYPKVKPGAEIYVPSKPERKGITAAATVGLASAFASLALVVVTILNSTK
ncbi:protein involved in polysaccharide export, contains SLBB domain of the beta-grasp fold [Chitinophaga sp. YR627]|uniref:SLBB domain-containing protein n=1 Tax=Chitinophaga sp. YR627 TaxID=1881041 RepID=UPI0008E9D70F|nr:SLBB domain-containing protein [Chitinophaga sp. YR627]SFN91811.1 protein involved in polysaccharide export, contains SLBB domain of the beta-grasp fold [Chitinophaga sp. YR627]